MIIASKITHSTIFMAKRGVFIVKIADFLCFFICLTTEKWSDKELKRRNTGKNVIFLMSCDKGLKIW